MMRPLRLSAPHVVLLAVFASLHAAASTSPLESVVQLDVGGRHACAVTATGGVKCWGENSRLILGDGTTFSRAWAADVIGLPGSASRVTASRGWDQLQPDVAHTCAIVAGGQVWCWGDNNRGQLGFGVATVFAVNPGPVSGLSLPAVEISAGWAHTCAVLSDGTVSCWGDNSVGQLGDGTTISRMTATSVPGLTGIAKIAAGPQHTCALQAAGGVLCWGALGGPSPTAVAGLSNVVSISAGGTRQHPCTLSGDSLICAKTSFLTAFGSGHSCAVTAAGAARCWGENAFGQAGDGTIVSHLAPTDVVGLTSGVSGISAGGAILATASTFTLASGETNRQTPNNSCAVTSSGGVKCWGRDFCGLLGSGGTADCDQTHPAMSSVPVDVVGLSSVQQVSAGGEFSCALTTAGAVQCWGLGYGTTPLPVLAGTPPTGTVASGTNPRLGNISTRAAVLTGNNVLIAGFTIGGSTSKTIAIQASGPSLVTAGITTPLANPTIRLMRGPVNELAANDDWVSATNASQLQDSGFAPMMSDEPALVATLEPGPYTVIVSGADGGTGTGVVGVFELDHPESPLVNISTRAQVTGSDVMIAGFVVQGGGPRKVAVTVAGPSLGPAGIANPLANPTLTLVRQSDGTVITANDDWQSGATAAQLLAAHFAPADPAEPGVLLLLDPGAYTAIVQGVGGTTGVAVVGVFAVP